MKSTEIRKGMRVLLSFEASMGNTPRWQGTMMDNYTKRKTRVVEVEGDFTEVGSVYARDIDYVMVNGGWEKVQHDPSEYEV